MVDWSIIGSVNHNMVEGVRLRTVHLLAHTTCCKLPLQSLRYFDYMRFSVVRSYGPLEVVGGTRSASQSGLPSGAFPLVGPVAFEHGWPLGRLFTG